MAPRVKKSKTPKQEEQVPVQEVTPVPEVTPEPTPEPVQEVTPVPEVTPEPVQDVTLESVPEPEKPNFSNHFDALMSGVVSLTKKCKELEIEVKSLKYLYNKEHKPVKPVVKRKQVQKKQKTECC